MYSYSDEERLPSENAPEKWVDPFLIGLSAKQVIDITSKIGIAIFINNLSNGPATEQQVCVLLILAVPQINPRS